MWILVIILIGVVIFGLIAGFFYNRSIQKKIERGELKEAPEIKTVDEECFKGHPSDNYTEEEINEFREIMYTMKEEEVAGWCRSLQLRGIEIPDELKDEVFLIVGERRFH